MVEIKSNGKYNVLGYGINVWNNDPTKQQNTKPHLLYLCIDNHYCMGLLIYHINQVLRKLVLLMICRQNTLNKKY